MEGRWCTGRFLRGIRFLMSDLLGASLNADRIRPSGFEAAVENRAADGRLGLLRGKTPRPQPGADDYLISADPVFDQRAAAISGLGLPGHPTVRGNHGDVLIPLRGRAVTLLYDRICTGRNDDARPGAVAYDGIIDGVAIIGAVGSELINWAIDHIEQRRHL
jgi:hypothetical protein